jgi:hypothetical protein
MLVSRLLIFRFWWWRQHVPPKRRLSLTDYTALYTRRYDSSWSLLWEPHFLHAVVSAWETRIIIFISVVCLTKLSTTQTMSSNCRTNNELERMSKETVMASFEVICLAWLEGWIIWMILTGPTEHVSICSTVTRMRIPLSFPTLNN